MDSGCSIETSGSTPIDGVAGRSLHIPTLDSRLTAALPGKLIHRGALP